ncbi:hypothetical protein NHJ13051_007701 [Beauveria bassiana]
MNDSQHSFGVEAVHTKAKILAPPPPSLADQLIRFGAPAGRSDECEAFNLPSASRQHVANGRLAAPSCAHAGGMQAEAEHKESLYRSDKPKAQA